MTDEQIAFETFASGIRKRLAKADPDYQGIATELLGARDMALALGSKQAADRASLLHREVVDAWVAASTGYRPDAAVQAAIAAHGPEAVHRAAQAQLEGDGGAAMLAVGIEPATAGDCWRAMSAAHDAMDEEQRQRVEARNDAALESREEGAR